MGSLQLYRYNDPTAIIDTQYGTITYLRWLEKEKERIEKDSTRTAEIVTATKGGEVALFANVI
jgi:hypothetical protein